MIITKNKKSLILASLLSFASCFSFAFDWPQDEVLSDSFYSYFGQLRGGTISSSLIFSELSSVKSVDAGKVIAVISEHEDMDWFESTLGNAVIISHKDDLMTIYGNLDSEGISEDLDRLAAVQTGTYLGVSGNSGWQQGKSCLEFQVIDTKQKTSVNPRILMPRIGQELNLEVGVIVAVSKNGTVYPIRTQMTLPAGNYYFYRTRQKTAIPYRTGVSINGALVEKISYDSLKQDNMKLCVAGNKLYPVEIVYPDNEKQLIADINLSSGRNILAVSVANILGAEKTATYVLNVR